MIYNDLVVDQIRASLNYVQFAQQIGYISSLLFINLDKKIEYQEILYFLAGVVGIEPTPSESEADVLPLHHTPPNLTRLL